MLQRGRYTRSSVASPVAIAIPRAWCPLPGAAEEIAQMFVLCWAVLTRP